MTRTELEAWAEEKAKETNLKWAQSDIDGHMLFLPDYIAAALVEAWEMADRLATERACGVVLAARGVATSAWMWNPEAVARAIREAAREEGENAA